MGRIDVDRELIGKTIDANGDQAPASKPIENPGPAAGATPGSGEDPLLDPHPDEPGVKSDGEAGPAENPEDPPGEVAEEPSPHEDR